MHEVRGLILIPRRYHLDEMKQAFTHRLIVEGIGLGEVSVEDGWHHSVLRCSVWFIMCLLMGGLDSTQAATDSHAGARRNVFTFVDGPAGAGAL